MKLQCFMLVLMVACAAAQAPAPGTAAPVPDTCGAEGEACCSLQDGQHTALYCKSAHLTCDAFKCVRFNVTRTGASAQPP